jgi:ferredoxin
VPASLPKPSKPTKSRRHKLPTLADVAREAGVSDVAASCALNGAKGSTRVSAETRERVLAAAENCPVEAIMITLLESGEPVFPPEE